jgi:hypothetical protein
LNHFYFISGVFLFPTFFSDLFCGMERVGAAHMVTSNDRARRSLAKWAGAESQKGKVNWSEIDRASATIRAPANLMCPTDEYCRAELEKIKIQKVHQNY